MTTTDLAALATPYARTALRNAKDDVVAAIGMPAWLVLWPSWAVVTGPLLPLLLKIGIELAVGLSAPQFLPLLGILCSLSVYLSPSAAAAIADLESLLKTPTDSLCGPVRHALIVTPGLPSKFEIFHFYEDNGPMNKNPKLDDLAREILQDVLDRHEGQRYAAAAPGVAASAVVLPAALAYAPVLIQALLNAANAQFGPTFEVLVDSQKALIRSLISQQVLDTLTATIKGLGDVPAAT